MVLRHTYRRHTNLTQQTKLLTPIPLNKPSSRSSPHHLLSLLWVSEKPKLIFWVTAKGPKRRPLFLWVLDFELETMVGIFSRFSIRSIHRRTQSALDQREMLPPISEGAISTGSVTAGSHGIEVAVEFKPVEHPIEPLDNDRPIQCPLPEPSILHDGRIWKERASATSMRRRADLPVMKEGVTLESDIAGTRLRTSQPKRMILPSMSAPEHDILKLLEECNASGI